ncbi:hypothetical protein [Sphingomonas sp. NFX23]|uniref:hypothetical protein n=1 Tax=Sphingomonas sp. NFX23 TaxID=2819532 RepID=UPI003CF1D23D
MSQVSDIIVNWAPETSGRVSVIQIRSRIVGTTEWTEQSAGTDASLGEFRFSSNAPATDVEVQIRYRMVSGLTSPWTSDHIVTAPVTIPYVDLTGTPSKLADINGTEGGKLTGIENNATDGATVGDNIKDINGNNLGRDQIINAEGSFNAVATYNFDDDTFQGVMSGGANISVAPGSGILRFEATTTDPMIYIPINRPGKDAYIIRVLARRLSETNSWQGQVYYSINNGRGESEGFTKRIPTPDIVANKWTVFEWDMRNLTAGGTDYIDSDIVRARIDLDQALTVWEIEAIQIGNRQGASLGAPDGTLVGGKPVEDIIDAITNPAGQLIPIKDILVDVNDLQTTFGDTVSAGAARDAAKASQDAAKLSEDTVAAAKAAVLVSQSAAKVSEDNAGKAKDQASAAQGLAEAAARDATAKSGSAGQASADASAAKTAAQTAQSDAEAKARAAGVSANDASGYATTASGWASNAQQKADAAGQSATIATGKADIATTKAAEALVSSNNASASESNAAGSASSASQQAVVSSRAAQDSAANAANDNRSPGAAPTLWAYNDYNNFKPITRLPATANGDFSYADSVLRVNNGFHIHPVEPMRVDPSKRYRAVVRFKLVQVLLPPKGLTGPRRFAR